MKKHQRNHSGCAFELTMGVMFAPAHLGCAGGGPGGVHRHPERVYKTIDDHRAHQEEDRMIALMILGDKYLGRQK